MMPSRLSLGEGRRVPSSVLFVLVGVCAVLAVLCASLISTLVLIRKHQDNVDRRRDMETVSNHTMETLKPWEREVRLPAGVTPLHYRILLRPDLEAGTFSGTVDIDIKVTEPTPFLALHVKALNVTKTSLEFEEKEVSIRDAFFSASNGVWVIRLPENSPLPTGAARLSLSFNGSLLGKIVGFYRSLYSDLNTGRTRVIATSKFEPVDARAAFPCFDEPALKATFSISLVRPQNEYSALSNMDVASEETGPGPNEVTVHFSKSVPMSTYLVCFIVSDFKSSGPAIVENNGTDLPVQVYATDQQVPNTALALSVARQVTEFYLDYFRIPYPLPKLDLIAIPDFVSGAMEHWGLITFRETALLFDENTNSASAKKRVASVVAHEIAHQWFGNLVTMAWWDDLWLNEGFASFMESKSLSQGVAECADWQMLDQVVFDDIQPVLKVDSALNSHSIVQSVSNPDQINQLFDSVSYDKGQSILRMLEDFMGQEVFRQGLTAYLSSHVYGNARTEDLWKSLDAAMNGDGLVPDVMATWTRQMGFPVLQVTRFADSIKLTQERYLADVDLTFNTTESPFGYKWDIPIRYITSEHSTPTLVWLRRSMSQLTLPINNLVSFVKFNAKQKGFYRVNYESSVWKVLTRNIMKMEPLDRAHLLDDVFSLAGSGHTSYSNALNMIEYLKTETEYMPWATGTTALRELGILLATTNTYPAFRKFVVNLVSGLYGTKSGQFSWTVPENDSHLNRLLRVKILSAACAAGHSECLRDVGSLFQTWLSNPSKTAIAPDLRNLVYFYGMKAVGKEKEWDLLWNLYLKETNAQERINFLEALANAQEPWLLQRFLEFSWQESNVRSQDYLSVLAYIARTPVGAPILWDFYRSQWPLLVQRFGLQHRTLGSTVLSVTTTFCTQLRLDELRAFYAAYPDAGAGSAARINAEEKIETRIKWISRNKEQIQQWLSSHV